MAPSFVHASEPVPQKTDYAAGQDYEEIMPLTNVRILQNTPIFISSTSGIVVGTAIAGNWYWVSAHTMSRVQIGPNRWVYRRDTTF